MKKRRKYPMKPVEKIEAEIKNRKLQKYILEKRCSELAKIYWVNLEKDLGKGYAGRVIAPNPRTAVYYFLKRGWGDWESKFNKLYSIYQENGGIGKFARYVGRFG